MHRTSATYTLLHTHSFIHNRVGGFPRKKAAYHNAAWLREYTFANHIKNTMMRVCSSTTTRGQAMSSARSAAAAPAAAAAAAAAARRHQVRRCCSLRVAGNPQQAASPLHPYLVAIATQQQQCRRRRIVASAAPNASSDAAAANDDADEADGDEGADEGEWDEWGDDEDDEGEWLGEGEEDEEDEEEAEEEAEEGGGGAAAGAGASSGPPPIPEDVKATPYVEGAFVEVGRVARAHGVRGELRIAPLTDAPKRRFARGKRLWLQPPQPRGALARAVSSSGAPPGQQQRQQQQRQQQQQQQPPYPNQQHQQLLRRVTVEAGRMLKADAKGRPGSGAWGVKLTEVADRTAAEALAGHTLLLAVCDRERRAGGRDDFFVSDLVGMRVHDSATTALVGLVTEVYDVTGPTATLRVRLAPSRDDIAASTMRLALVPFAREIVPAVDVAARRMELAAPEGLLDTATKRKLRRPYTPEQAAALLAQLEAEEARVAGVAAAAAADTGKGDGNAGA